MRKLRTVVEPMLLTSSNPAQPLIERAKQPVRGAKQRPASLPRGGANVAFRRVVQRGR